MFDMTIKQEMQTEEFLKISVKNYIFHLVCTSNFL